MRQRRIAVVPVAALDSCPSSLPPEPPTPSAVATGSSALPQLLASMRPDLAAQLPPEDDAPQLEPEPPILSNSRKRRGRVVSRTPAVKKHKTPVPPAPAAPCSRGEAAVRLAHAQARWLLPPCDEWDDGVLPCSLAFLSDEKLDVPVRIATLMPVQYDDLRHSARPPSNLFLFTSPVPNSEASVLPEVVAVLPTLSTTRMGESNGRWLHAAARLAASGHVAIDATLRVERAPGETSTLAALTIDKAVQAIYPIFALHLEVKVWLTPRAFQPSFTAAIASDLVDLLCFVSAAPKAEVGTQDLARAATADEYLAMLQSHGDALRQTRADASWIYTALRRPSSHGSDGIPTTHPLSEAALLPYQRRTVAFLLGREGKRVVPAEFERDAATSRIVRQEGEGARLPNAHAVGTSSEAQKPSPTVKVGSSQLASLAADAASPHVMTTFGPQTLGMWWERVCLRSLGARTLYFNTIYGYFTFDPATASTGDVKASLLAEEMGLGKTVELLFLILWNVAPAQWTARPAYWSDWLQAMITPSKATLIVVPETLREQWTEEVRRHAPKLRVYSFQSTRQAEKDAADVGLAPQNLDEGHTISAWEQYAQRLDVVITTYTTLRGEVHKALAERPRSRRTERKYPRERSGLVTVGWWRVAVDEVQLLGGTTQAFITASLLPRHMSVCVSGTPVQSIKDLEACLTFLRVPGLAWPEDGAPPGPVDDAATWILDRRMKPQLMRLLAWLGVRHSKHDVRAEMVLPPQTRQLVPVEMTRIERAFYTEMFRRTMDDLGLSHLSLHETLARVWSEDPTHSSLIADLGDLVRRLRQACTHPQVVSRSNLGALWGLRLRGIDDVLVLMIEQGHNERINATLLSFQRKITRASLILQNTADPNRLTLAQGLLGDAADDLNDHIEHLSHDANRAHLVGPLYTFTQDTLAHALKTHKGDVDASSTVGLHNSTAEDTDGEAEKHIADQLKARAHHISTTRDRVLRYREQLHRAYQFLGHTNFQLGETWDKEHGREPSANGQVQDVHSSERAGDVAAEGAAIQVQRDAVTNDTQANPYKGEEDRMYHLAEQLRRLLLNESSELVGKAVEIFNQRRLDLSRDAVTADTPRDWLMATMDASAPVPMVGSHLVKMYGRWIAQANKQAACLFRWRAAIYERVSHAVNRDVDLAKEDDDQFAENLDRQHEAEAYLDMYRVLLAEREYLVAGVDVVGSREPPLLFRQLEDTIRGARFLSLTDPEYKEPPDVEAARQQLAVFQRLYAELKDVILPPGMFPLRQLSSELRNLADRVLNSVDAQLVGSVLSHSRAALSEQTKLLERVKRESALLMTIYNARSTYFKRIQQLSDTVADAEARDIPRAIENNYIAEVKAAKELGKLAARVRYLENLWAAQKNSGAMTGEDEPATAPECIVCTDRIIHGVLIDVCGHLVCEDCYRQWTQSQQRKTCPVCRTRLARGPEAVHRVTYRAEGGQAAETLSKAVDHTSVELGLMRAKQQNVPGGSAVSAPGVRQVNLDAMHVIGAQQRVDVLDTPITGNHGCKIDMGVAHLRRIILHSTDKALVFSNFARGLDLVGAALRRNEILFVRSDASGSRAREYPARGPGAVDRGASIGGRRTSGTVSTKHCASVFQNEPEVRVFLLHADSQASGLNLTAARHVFLLAPLANKGMEMQAIGRVHRIGQTKPTHVWGYFVLDSVEETLVHLSAQRGHSIFSRDAKDEDEDRDGGEVAMPAKRDKGGDLVTSRTDLITCLFHPPDSHSDAEPARPAPHDT